MIWVRSKYNYSNTLALIAYNDDGSPYGVATVYLDGQSEKLPSDCAFVDTNNWPDIVEMLKKEELVEEIEEAGVSGFCVYLAMKFNLDKILDPK